MTKIMILSLSLFAFLSWSAYSEQAEQSDSDFKAYSSQEKYATGIGGSSGGPKQSWGDIFTNPDLIPEFPRVVIQGQSIRYHRLCLIGKRIRTKYKRPIFNSMEGPLYEYLYTDRYREEMQCLQVFAGRCLHWADVAYEIPLMAPIAVYKNTQDGHPLALAFVKKFELQACESF
jgi:hypothetical protein